MKKFLKGVLATLLSLVAFPFALAGGIVCGAFLMILTIIEAPVAVIDDIFETYTK